MYIFNADKKLIKRQSVCCEEVGLANATLSNILNRKVACRQVVAFALTKYIDKNADIEDYFIRIEE